MNGEADFSELEKFNAEMIEHRSNATQSCADALYGQIKEQSDGVLMQGAQVVVVKTSTGARVIVRKNDPSI